MEKSYHRVVTPQKARYFLRFLSTGLSTVYRGCLVMPDSMRQWMILEVAGVFGYIGACYLLTTSIYILGSTRTSALNTSEPTYRDRKSDR